MRTYRVSIVLAIAMILGCGGGSRPAPAPARAVVARPVTPPPDPLNLSFERGEPPEGWASDPYGSGPLIAPAGYAIAVDTTIRHDGQRSLRVTGEGTAASVVRGVPIDGLRGRTVHLRGWIRTRGVTGAAYFIVRADGASGPLAFDHTRDRGPKGDTEWTRYELDLRVAPEATAVVIGMVLTGGGQAWVDGLEVTSSEAAPDVEVRGLVVDANGRGVPGAVVAAIRPHMTNPGHVTTTAADGSFAFEVDAGPWAFTATSDAGAAAYVAPQPVTAGTELRLSIGGDGVTIEGRVLAFDGVQADRVVATARSALDGDIFVTRPDARGHYRLRLPRAPADSYDIAVVTQGLAEEPKTVEVVDQTLDLRIGVAAAPPSEVVAWIRSAAQPLVTVEAGHGFADLAGFGRMIGEARIVGLGEATHGGREFFQLKHRLLEYLVVEKGFRLFAIEDDRAWVRHVNDYVLHGKGTAREAIKHLMWLWKTEEVLALLEWMRTYNLDANHKTKVQFVGIDMQDTTEAATGLLAYLDKVDPAYRRSLPASYSSLRGEDTLVVWPKRPAAERVALHRAADAIVARLDRERRSYVKRSSAAAWRVAREDARQVAQALEMYDAYQGVNGVRASIVRDRAMAENVAWIVDENARSKVVVWAHNMHLSKGIPLRMGAHLDRRFGTAYRAVNLAFSRGGTRASPPESGASGNDIRGFELGAAPESDVTAMFTKAGLALAIVDLRAAPPGPVARWLEAPHPLRSLGYVFLERATVRNEALAAGYDVVAFVAVTTAARSLAKPAKPAN